MSDRNCACTPGALWQQLHSEYGFTIDAAASASNAKLKRFWSQEQDALLQDWSRDRIWCNPPYRQPGAPIVAWVNRPLAHKPPVAVFLLPNSTSAQWFLSAWKHGEIHFFNGRIEFVPPPGVKYQHLNKRTGKMEDSGNDRDSVLVVLGREAKKRRVAFRDAKTGKLL